jgi:hypothetical protein
VSNINTPSGNHAARLIKRIEQLERENAALRHSEENMAATVRGLEFELEKAQTENTALREALDAQMQYQRELRADRDRLDYMEECSVDIELGLDETGAMKFAHIYIDRAAIDAARVKEGGVT